MDTDGLDVSKLIVSLSDAREAKTLPPGIAVGDTCGGRSFNDNIAAVLESRSRSGWQEVALGDTIWTVIVLTK
jgi:hypothetical protein